MQNNMPMTKGCRLLTPHRVAFRLSRILFCGSIAFNSGLFSLLLLVCAGPFMPSGDFWEGFAYLWLFSLPVVVVCASACWQVYPRYVAAAGVAARVVLYVGLVIATSVAAPGITLLMLIVVARVAALRAA